MSKASKANKTKSPGQKKPVEQNADTSRRKFLLLGVGGVGALAVTGIAGYSAGWFGSSSSPSTPAVAPTPNLATGKPLPPATLPANATGALQAADDIVRHYARELNNPSALIHGVRCFGKNFQLNNGSKVVDFLCSQFAAENNLNGKRYIYFPRSAEVHDNSFLKTLLEAGVSLDQPITVGANRYTLRDLGESAKALFRCDPQNFGRFDPSLVHQHLPWGLIAFSILVPPSQATWTNAYGETINLPVVIDKGLGVYEGTCAGVKEGIERGEDEPLEFRQAITKYSCFGMHTAYGFLSCWQHGYRDNKLPERLNQMLDSVIFRLKGDSLAIDTEAEAVKGLGPEYVSKLAIEEKGGRIATKGSPPPATIEVMRWRSQIRMLGHALEAINYAQLHKLFTPTAGQQKRLQAGEQLLYDYLTKMRATDLQPYMNWYPKFVSDIVIAVAHASRAMKLLTPENPDTIA